MSAALVPLDKSAVSVVSMLEHAKQWLATAVETTGPAEIAAAKAQIVTAETYARELRLSQDIREDAVEMVRRAEYALGKSIRKGQADGTIFAPGKNPATDREYVRNGRVIGGAVDRTTSSSAVPVTALASSSDLYNHKGNIMDLAEATVEELDTALEAAREEGNLSRANVVRKIGKTDLATRRTRAEKADLLEDLAQQGFSSRQMCKALAFSRDEQVRELAREYGIEIPADRSIVKSRRINSTHLVENTATALEGLVMGIELIDYEAVDPAVASQWADSLDDSLKKLRSFATQIRKATQ